VPPSGIGQVVIFFEKTLKKAAISPNPLWQALSGNNNMQINHVFRFEKLRDGGSLIVSFQSNDSCEYWVMFPFVKDIENPEFGDPVLINRTTGIEVDLSLEGANQWLKTLEPYFHQRPELPHVSKQTEIDIFNKMIQLCKLST
jgi:hypothetical protein